MRALAAAFAAAWLVMWLPAGVRTQEAAAGASPTSFEVAAIKRSAPPGGGNGPFFFGTFYKGDRWTASGTTLRLLLRAAHPNLIVNEQIVGAPDWVDSNRFEITAKTEGIVPREALPPLVRALLAERFKLKTHIETREMPVYTLVSARDDKRLGPKLTPVDVDCEALAKARESGAAPAPPPFKPGAPAPPCSVYIMASPQSSRMAGGAMTVAELARMLGTNAGRPVLDRTGLSGRYAVDMEFAREAALPPAGAPPPLLPPGPEAGLSVAAPPPSDVPSLFAAVQEQLGLKLESSREQMEVLVIDHVEMPEED